MKAQEVNRKEATLLEEAVLKEQEGIAPEWISYPAAERFTGLSHVTLWRRVSAGEIRSARVGRSVRIHLPSLKAFMEERAEGPTEK
jgi:excisionase family DNA binding protein